MNSVTKNHQTEETIRAMTEKALGNKVGSFSCSCLSGGFCSAVYLVNADEQRLVLKVASDDAVKVMRHEKRYVSIEAEMLSILNEKTDIPMPKLIAYDDSRSVCSVPYFFMTFIDGTPLSQTTDLSESEYRSIKREVGVITRKICDIPAEHFGIPQMPETFTDKNSQFTLTLFDMLLTDANEKKIPIPSISPDRLMSLIGGCKEALDADVTPCLAHTDTWAGNVMVKNGRLAGFVDFAAILYGDKLISHDFHDFGDNPTVDFLEGFGASQFSAEEKIRIQIYKIWQRLGMIVERGYREYTDPNMYGWVLGEFTNAVNELVLML